MSLLKQSKISVSKLKLVQMKLQNTNGEFIMSVISNSLLDFKIEVLLWLIAFGFE